MRSPLRRLKSLKRLDAAAVVTCIVLALGASTALASSQLFLNVPSEPPGQGTNNGPRQLNNHIWAWASNGSACIHYYIVSVGQWTTPQCSTDFAGEQIDVYPGYAPLTQAGAWNNPSMWYGTHWTQAEAWW